MLEKMGMELVVVEKDYSFDISIELKHSKKILGYTNTLEYLCESFNVYKKDVENYFHDFKSLLELDLRNYGYYIGCGYFAYNKFFISREDAITYTRRAFNEIINKLNENYLKECNASYKIRK
jgi:hypothetical protein